MQQSLATNEAIEPRQRSHRAPVLRVRCRCNSEQEFVQRYAADVCVDGMFLRTQQALPVGARVRFELLLQNGRCALGGVGRVAWVRQTDHHDIAAALRGGREQQRPGGAGIAFERLRRGDRAVIERMDSARGDVPSRFERPDALTLVPPPVADLATTLFADLGVRSGVEPGASAFLSADLSQELGEGGWQLGARGRDAEHPIADLAEQLEPASERELADDDDPEVDVELVAPPAVEPAAPHSTVRPSPVSAARPASRVAAAQSPSKVYAVSGDSAVSLALARSAVKAATGPRKPASPLPAASLRARVDRVSKPKTLAAPAPIRRTPVTAAPVAAAPVAAAPVTAAPVAAAPAPAPAPAKQPTAVPAAPSMPSLSVTARIPARRRTATAPVAAALTTIIILAIAVTYLSLTDQLAHVLRALGL